MPIFGTKLQHELDPAKIAETDERVAKNSADAIKQGTVTEAIAAIAPAEAEAAAQKKAAVMTELQDPPVKLMPPEFNDALKQAKIAEAAAEASPKSAAMAGVIAQERSGTEATSYRGQAAPAAEERARQAAEAAATKIDEAAAAPAQLLKELNKSLDEGRSIRDSNKVLELVTKIPKLTDQIMDKIADNAANEGLSSEIGIICGLLIDKGRNDEVDTLVDKFSQTPIDKLNNHRSSGALRESINEMRERPEVKLRQEALEAAAAPDEVAAAAGAAAAPDEVAAAAGAAPVKLDRIQEALAKGPAASHIESAETSKGQDNTGRGRS
jgi:hypothetical protein